MEKLRNAFRDQFEQLKKKVIWRADQLGIDLTEDGVIENLLKISDGATDADGNTNDSWEVASWPERIFATAFRCSTENDVGDTGGNELIDALCLGNWAIGFVDGLPGEKSDPSVCVSCQIKQHVSAIGKSGGAAKAAKYQPLKDRAIELVNARKWKSRRNAAITVLPEILALARKLNIGLAKDQAQITITGWLKEAGLPANI